MGEAMLSERQVNTGRQREVDLLKAICIIFMIVEHCCSEMLVTKGYALFDFVTGLMAPTMGAQSFMVCMGIGIAYSKVAAKGPAAAGDYARRGVSLLVVGQVLNLARFAVPYGTLYALTGDVVARSWVFMVFTSDIMQFAGLFFLCLALLSRLGLDSVCVFAASLALSVVGTLVDGRVATGSYVLDQLLAMFVNTGAESYFPLFGWMVFPAFGMLLGGLLSHVRDKGRFYRALLPSLLVLTLAYYHTVLSVDQGLFVALRDDYALSHVGVFEALAQCACCTCLLSLLFFVGTILPEAAMRGVAFVSSNINRFYCVQWVLVSLANVCVVLSVEGPTSSGGIVLFCLITLSTVVATTAIVWVYQRWLAKPVGAIVARHKTSCYILVVVLSVAACVWAGQGIGWDYASFPNHSNEYNDSWPDVA